MLFRSWDCSPGHAGKDGPHLEMTEGMPEGQQPRGVTPRPRSGAAAESARLRQRRNNREELPYVRGQGQRPGNIQTRCPNSWSNWSKSPKRLVTCRQGLVLLRKKGSRLPRRVGTRPGQKEYGGERGGPDTEHILAPGLESPSPKISRKRVGGGAGKS